MAVKPEVYSMKNADCGLQVKERINSSTKDKTQLDYTYLIYCLLSEQRWHSMGNLKWAGYYRERAKSTRLKIRRRKEIRPKVEGFDWLMALGLKKELPVVTIPAVEVQESVAA